MYRVDNKHVAWSQQQVITELIIIREDYAVQNDHTHYLHDRTMKAQQRYYTSRIIVQCKECIVRQQQ